MIAIPQIIAALIIGTFYYMVAVVMTMYDGLLTMILQPIIGGIFTAIAIAVLIIIGLPIRLVRSINQWWRYYWWIPLTIGTIAFVMMCASWHPSLRIIVFDSELQRDTETFNPVLSIGGWLLTLFAVLHFYPSRLFDKNKDERIAEPAPPAGRGEAPRP